MQLNDQLGPAFYPTSAADSLTNSTLTFMGIISYMCSRTILHLSFDPEV